MLIRSAVYSLNFFLLIMRPPRRCTLFPYTTLFRSDRMAWEQHGLKLEYSAHAGAGEIHVLPLINLKSSEGRAKFRALLMEDRKSTRLNSSHRCISYAVFCLKKKNKQYKYSRNQKNH